MHKECNGWVSCGIPSNTGDFDWKARVLQEEEREMLDSKPVSCESCENGPAADDI